ncbi:hypothetical protein NP233_g8874 [Leucocoprinus birnbaumii]|uniref:Cytochrome P450 n=1 Tax=Leucocoprinus birnbaumii TaxID=56174 RepID=A0AAD5YRF2_9AGAR|nr:hypothetical protein NP233_g8874 [Leucocoprinus birnbaumii]
MSFMAKAYKDMGDRLGSKILYLEAFGQSIVVLNDFRMASDLLDKRSALYSSRPHMNMLMDVVGIDYMFGAMPYGQEWRRYRRLFQQYYAATNIEGEQEKMIEFVRKGILPNMLQSPRDSLQHIRDGIGGYAISSTYGCSIRKRGDTTLKESERAFDAIAQASAPGTFFVEIIPILRYIPEWVPGAGFKVLARATDTTSAAVTTFILAMLLNPRVQNLAQQEIDAVIGRERLPNFSDLPHLPYLSAVFKEVLRCIPHYTIEEDTYEGYRIPKGSIVLANAVAMLHDGEVFEDPNEFIPERYIRGGKINPDVPDPEDYATFGFGRRACPGSHIAMANLSITAVSILSVFDISPELNEDGIPIKVVPQFRGDALTSSPLPFPFKITPRVGVDIENLLKEYMDFEMI